MFIIKIKGKAKIPDFIQLRDDNMILLEYFSYDKESIDQEINNIIIEQIQSIKKVKFNFGELLL